MHKKILQFIALLFLFTTVSAQNNYQYKLDLVNVVKDQVKVTLIPPKMDKDELVFVMPKVIPGSYSIKNYGRFIKKFVAFDTNGKKLKTKQVELNKFFIYNAASIARIEYWVDDTWDDKNRKDFVFQPGGSNIEAGANFVINPHCFFGYFNGYKSQPFKIEVNKPAEMYGSGYLTKTAKDKNTDIIEAPNYFFLSDNPLMYCKPDTTSFDIASAKIHISVYSATGLVNSKKVAQYLEPVAGALKSFLTGFPVSEYYFLYYFDDPDRLVTSKSKGLSGGYGALEHNHSSFYYLNESKIEKSLSTMIEHVSSHEFLHLVTPLNLHSVEIENFDFLDPKMSQHLWMYEGTTEYFSLLAQVRGGIMTEKEFRKEIRSRINRSEEFGNFSMTEMSKNVLTPKNQALYLSVYSKGAVLAMLLDIRIATLTDGKKNLRSVMVELSQKYGSSKPFNDDDLFNDIVALTHPKVRDFIDAYIIGSRSLPYLDFAKVGWDYAEEKTRNIYFCGFFGIKYEEKNTDLVFTQVGQNVFGVLNGDVLLKINNIDVSPDNLSDLFDKYLQYGESDSLVSITIKRNNVVKVLEGIPRSGTARTKNYLDALRTPLDESQKELRKLIMNIE